MSVAQELPTEILCAIFEQSALNLTVSVPEPPPASSATADSQSSTPTTKLVNPATSATESNNFCALPSSKEHLALSIVLSQVCMRWRDIAIDLESLWTKIHLGLNAFVGRDNDDEGATDMTANFLSRSGQRPLSLDVSFTLEDRLSIHSYVQKARYDANIRRALLPHVERCISLRLSSNYIINAAVLDVFLEHNLSSPLNHSTLSHLHLEQTVPTNHPRHSHLTFPPDLGVIAPHLTTLYVDGAQVAVFPRWSIREMSLNNTWISYQNHFHLFMKATITKLVLHRVCIPGGQPYVRQITTDHFPSLGTLVLSELQCSGPEVDHQRIYALFFVLSISRTLQGLELSGLSKEAMMGLYSHLRVNLGTTMEGLRVLTLRKVKIDALMATALTTIFTAVGTLVLDRVDGGSKLVFDVWKKRREVWPQLTEVTLDGEIVERD